MFCEPDEVSLPASRAACFAHTSRGHPTLVMDVLCVVPSWPPLPHVAAGLCARRSVAAVGCTARLPGLPGPSWQSTPATSLE